MKKIGLVIIMIVLLATVANAASVNGDFKGNPIVNVKANGKELTVEKTPAVIYNDNTLVPIYMLRELGAIVTWDQKTYSVDVNLNTNSLTIESAKDKVRRLENIARTFGGKYFKIIYDSLGSYAQVRIDGTEDTTKDISNIHLLSVLSTQTDVDEIVIQYFYDNTFFQDYIVKTSDITDWLNKKISYDQLLQKWKIEDYKDDTSQTVPTSQTIALIYPELYSNDGKTYLGELTSNKYDLDSVFNEYGTYGSKYSVDSIWNTYGTYGSAYSSESAFNEYASKPPIIVLNGKIIRYLTTNSYTTNALSPYGLLKWLQDNGY